MSLAQLNFLTPKTVKIIAQKFATPTFVYSQKILEQNAQDFLNFPNEFGLTVRYAMKANSNGVILKIFNLHGLKIDASSEFEVDRALANNIPAQDIMLTSQQFPKKFIKGVTYNATSLWQLEQYGQRFPQTAVSIRLNPGLGSGGTKKTNTGGPAASFGIWYQDLPKIKKLLTKYKLTLIRLHTHIGSGSDPKIWQKVAKLSLNYVAMFKDVQILNLGGGFKIDRQDPKNSTDLQKIGQPVKQIFLDFYKKTGRKIKLEIEPGTSLVAMAGSLITTIIDQVSTGKAGYNFIKIDSGMTEVTRPALYAAWHPLVVVPLVKSSLKNKAYIVSGHCCESGDIWTPAKNNTNLLSPRLLRHAHINDLLVIEGVGAYCASMSCKNYNSFPEAAEVLFTKNKQFKLIRRQQTLNQIYQNECAII